MAIGNVQGLFGRVCAARKTTEIEVILKELGDSQSIGLDQKFGSLECRWTAYGGRESNQSTIGLAGKAGRSLTERVTNNIDALIELERRKDPEEPPSTPYSAVKKWFGRTPTGPREGLFQIEDKESDLSRRMGIVLSDSGNEDAPTIDSFDNGVGLTPEEMPNTILSLHEGNKANKRYLMGAFGQGGSSTLAFSKFVVIFSRAQHSPERVGFTIAKIMDPGDDYDLEVYTYLTIDGKIPSVELADKQLELYADTNLKRPPKLPYGTVVRHVGFELPGLTRRLSPYPGNLYHFLHLSMFDPLLPFRICDVRGDVDRDERVGGSRNRLMKLVEKGATNDGEEGGRVSVKHHHEMEYITPVNSQEKAIGVEYWVVEALKKPKKKGDAPELRPSSSALFVDHGHPVVATLNGQNQGELTAKFLKDLGLGMVSRHIVVHIDASKIHRTTRRKLFTTTREGFKEGPELDNLKATLGNILKDDLVLAKIERELTDRVVNRDSRSTNNKVKKQITRLLRDAGFSRTKDGEGVASDGEEDGGESGSFGTEGSGSGSGESQPVEPLPTKPFPEVSRWEIVSPKKVIKVPMEGRAVLKIETDADSQFDERNLIDLEFDPEKVEIASVSVLRGGRKRWRLRVADGAEIGDMGTVTAVIKAPDGSDLYRSAIPFEVIPPRQKGDKTGRGMVPDFEVEPISPDDTEKWNLLWPSHENAPRSEKEKVAYKVLSAGDKTIIYYSTAFAPYAERVKRRTKQRADRFIENYAIWIGYHAILQFPDQQQSEDDEEKSLEAERCRVAQVQARVADDLEEMQRKLATLSTEAEV